MAKFGILRSGGSMTLWINLSPSTKTSYTSQLQHLWDMGIDTTGAIYHCHEEEVFHEGSPGHPGYWDYPYLDDLWAFGAGYQYHMSLVTATMDWRGYITGPPGILPPLRAGFMWPAGYSGQTASCGNPEMFYYPTPTIAARIQNQTYESGGRIIRIPNITYATDVYLSKKIITNYRCNGSVEASHAAHYAMSLYLQQKEILIYLISGRITDNPITSYDVDANLEKTFAVTYSIDLFLQQKIKVPYAIDTVIKNNIAVSYTMGGHILKDEFPTIRQIQAFNLKFPDFSECGAPYDSRNEV